MTQRWFITGVARGIGRALSEAALERGDIVVGAARAQGQADTFARLKPGAAYGVALDLDDHGRIAEVAAKAIELAGGRIDIVVNNAGRSLWAPLEEVSIKEAKALFETNVFGPLAVMQAFMPHFRASGGGTFVNLSSGCGLVGTPGVGAYCGSKFALEGISETLAAEAAPFGVRVMLVEPGAVAGDFISHGTKDVGKRGGNYPFLDVGKRAMDGYYEAKAMSPQDVASRILEALDHGPPPMHLVVGDDLRPGIRAKIQGLAELLAD